MLYFSSIHPPHLLWKVVCLAYVGFCSPCILMLVSLLWWLLDNLIHIYAIYNKYGIYIYIYITILTTIANVFFLLKKQK